jgi:hypothetical protein
MRLEELPKKLQAAVLDSLAETARTGAAAADHARQRGLVPRPDPAHKPYRCEKCGQTYKGYATVERHVDTEHTAGRIEWSDR